MESVRQHRLVFWVLALPGTFWLTVFFLVPLGLIWAMSFGEKTSLIHIAITGTLDNYIRTTQWVYLQILWKSLWISAVATAICLVIAYPVAVGICFSPPRWKPLLLVAVILPFWINILIRTYALIAVFRTQGYLNYTLEWLWWAGKAVAAPLGLGFVFGERFEPISLLYNNGAVIAGLVYVYIPFMVLPLYAIIERLDKSYLEASLDLGASQVRTFFSVTVPLTMPGIISGIVLVFIPCLGAFLTPDLLGGANAVMIGNVIERQFKAANDWPFGAALSFLLMYATFGALALRSVLAGRRRGMEF